MLHPSIEHAAIELLVKIAEINIFVRFTSTFRTWQEQDFLYAKGRSSTGNIVTHAKGGESFHNYRLALDFCILLKDGKKASWDMVADNNLDGLADWMQIVKIAKKLGFEWSGDWKGKRLSNDFSHFQMIHGLTWQECKKRYENGLCDKNGYIFIT
jgi:peptidoglycan L-alanyl-D-glutamate endopeptidase CwlK